MWPGKCPLYSPVIVTECCARPHRVGCSQRSKECRGEWSQSTAVASADQTKREMVGTRAIRPICDT